MLWDALVIFNTDTTGSYRLGSGATTLLSAGTATIAGKTVSADIAGTLLPINGFDKTDYTWNLWPRDKAVAGLNAITDFAPNNINAKVDVVPLPGAIWLFGTMLAFFGISRTKR